MFLLLVASSQLFAQKKPLTHAVYDSWQSIGEKYISNDGKFVVYTIMQQEGDATLVIQSSDRSYKQEVPRGYNATITEDSKYIIFRIKPLFKDTREARIKKKKPEDMPKDSLAIMELGKDSILKIPRIKSYKTPEKGTGWIAYHVEKPLPETSKPKERPDSLTQVNNLIRMADSLTRVADSIRNKVNEAKTKGLVVLESPKKDIRTHAKPAETVEEGTGLIFRNLLTGQETTFELVNDYSFSKKGNRLVIKTTKNNSDTLSSAFILWVDTESGKIDTVFKTFNDVKNVAIDEEGLQLAFVAERDSSARALQKFYKLYYYQNGKDSARLRVDRGNIEMAKGFTVSENAFLNFSKDGTKLYFGIAPIRKPKDTTLVDFETAKLDIWHYNDDYLQPQQLVLANVELRRSYMAVLHHGQDKFIQLGSDSSENIVLVDEGNADYILATSTKGNRVSQQWEGFARQTAYIISTKDGSRKLVREKQRGFATASPKGKYIIWYDVSTKNYYTYNVSTGVIKNISKNIKENLYNDEDDHPDDPPPFGIAGWMEEDTDVLLNDRYDIWRTDPDGQRQPVNITNGDGKKNKVVFRYVNTDREKRFIFPEENILLSAFNRVSKYDGFFSVNLKDKADPTKLTLGPYAYSTPIKAKSVEHYIVNRMNVKESPDVYFTKDFISLTPLSTINPQQQEYNWLTSELVKWKMFDGKEAEGLLFKPENFDPKKKYPVIFYFYEKNADGLHNYRTPGPSASTINIAYFVSNGYLVFDPNIYYKNGEPGESAYNSVVSAAKYLAKMPWVDSTKMGIQGQSWGGYQVAYLVTRTKMFAAAGAGAPVANMTSAYGGIRWGTGLNRQFQYERSQTRLGASLWQRQDLYIKNSPLFRADKITTPLLIMHNDKDGAVPWYQGIELFTAMRRLGKKAWLLQYNDEDHNLVERRNRKDLSIRLSQFFDHYLKGAPAAKWIREGVPATLKGIEWGTEVEEKKAF
jgi:dipeptidyl aminopeptidase/acylaminoacyl peptidase